MKRNTKSGFTLIEILVAVGLIGILVGIAAFALQGGQRSGRDTRRKADLEQIRSGLEFYRSSCRAYPDTTRLVFGTALVGSGSPASCTGTFMERVPQDIAYPTHAYLYRYDSANNDYVLCAALEEAPIPAMNTSACGGSCGSQSCNYIVKSP